MIPQELLDQYRDRILNPSGNWSDFNKNMRLWEVMQRWTQAGFMFTDDLPDPPQPEDYPNLER